MVRRFVQTVKNNEVDGNSGLVRDHCRVIVQKEYRVRLLSDLLVLVGVYFDDVVCARD